ncbi:MAG: DASH complex subunit ask1 [Bathelium mastoideum]|nr:MAG: DASH complex subunit ask1 [Bathelium mastoideum]
MSRPNSAAARNLTLTEELEKLEQSITLTLQEIDHNFSKAHRIVTSSILPVVEQYGAHSKAVWEGSKFWKTFFEQSANITLNTYSEDTLEVDTTNDESQGKSGYGDVYDSPSIREDETVTSARHNQSNVQNATDTDSSLLDSPSVAGAQSTPRARSTTKDEQYDTEAPTFADYSSPYESLKSQIEQSPAAKNSKQTQPITPSKNRVAFPETTTTPPTSSPMEPPSAYLPSAQRRTNNDTLLHRMLDKTYRIQATPHAQRKALHQPASAARGSARTPTTTTRIGASRFLDSSPLDSSPGEEAPQLRPEIFSSPMKRAQTPRTPGVSVQTPAAKRNIANARRQTGFSAKNDTEGAKREGDDNKRSLQTLRREWDSDSDDDFADGLEGMSPPKTMQFVVPQGRLLQTPAREASKGIVEDLLLTAGGDITDDMAADADSPSVVKRNQELDDSF